MCGDRGGMRMELTASPASFGPGIIPTEPTEPVSSTPGMEIRGTGVRVRGYRIVNACDAGRMEDLYRGEDSGGMEVLR